MTPLAPATAQEAPAAEAPAEVPPAVLQLRHVIGDWDVETDFINPEGKVYTAKGTYSFQWVMPDKVVQGVSTIPEFNQSSGILFFHRPADKLVEMVSVGPDGQLWRMIGPEDGETRTTPNVAMPDGPMMLRFTRSNVAPDSFESMMEMSRDGGETWRIANRQRFVRRVAD